MPAKRRAIGTGGIRGIGRGTARQLAAADRFVVIGARDAAKRDAAVASLEAGGANVAALELDVNDTQSVRRFVEQVAREHGAPSVLVNNAGIYRETAEARVVNT